MNTTNQTAHDMDLAKVAHLARLGVTPEELNQLQEKINKTMGLIDRMQAVNTDDVTPLAHPLDMNQASRPDVTTVSPQAELQQCAPPNSLNNGLYEVPQVIE